MSARRPFTDLRLNPASAPYARGWGDRIRDCLLHRLMSAFGTKRTWRQHSAISAFGGKADITSGSDNHGALTICLHAGGKPASVSGGFGLNGGGCNFGSLNQKSSSCP